MTETQKPQDLIAAKDLDGPLAHCVRDAVRTYFEDMGDHDPENLMDLVIGRVEATLLAEVMEQVSGKQIQAAAVLGINRGTLRKKLRQHGLL
jgi:Fis family transcriptional regulator